MEQVALADVVLNQRALMAAALTGSLTLMSILTASIGILYGVYQRHCIPEVDKEGRPKPLEPVCQVIVNTAYFTILALSISAGTAFFAVLSLIGNYWWSGLLVKVLLLAELFLVPFIGIRIVRRLMPQPPPFQRK